MNNNSTTGIQIKLKTNYEKKITVECKMIFL